MTEIYTNPLEVEFPYVHSTGPALSRFFTALRDDGVIWGRRCPRCGLIVVPAQDYCDTCATDLEEWVEVGPGGQVQAFTIVHTPSPLIAKGVPFGVAVIRLDGADTGFVHLVGDPTGLTVGARVSARWAAERTGTISDLEGFEVVT